MGGGGGKGASGGLHLDHDTDSSPLILVSEKIDCFICETHNFWIM